MIVSHKYRYIFLKSRKTAGSSVELALAEECGPNDIIAAMRSEGRGGQNCLVPRTRLSARENVKALLKKVPDFPEHTSALDAKRWLGRDIWKSYFKFSIERNPWDRYLSQYYWNTRRGGQAEGKDIHEHFEWAASWRKSNWDIYAIGDQVVADKVVRYENLANDLADVTAELGLKTLSLPRAKSVTRPRNQHYSQVLPSDLVEKIRQTCAREIDYMGYTFEHTS